MIKNFNNEQEFFKWYNENYKNVILCKIIPQDKIIVQYEEV